MSGGNLPEADRHLTSRNSYRLYVILATHHQTLILLPYLAVR